MQVPNAMESTRQLEEEDEWAVWRVFEDNMRVLVRLLSRYSVPGNKAKVSEFRVSYYHEYFCAYFKIYFITY